MNALYKAALILRLKLKSTILICLVIVAGVGDYKAVKMKSDLVSFYGFDVSILTIDALIDAKKAAGRTKDLLILPELEGLKDLISRATEKE